MTPRSPDLPRPTTLEESTEYYKTLFEQCFAKCQDTMRLYMAKRDEVTSGHPNWSAGRLDETFDRVDARVAIYTKQINILITTSLHFVLYARRFCDLQWLQANIHPNYSSHLDVMERQFDNFFKFATGGCFYSIFHNTESMFRIFIKEIHPDGELLSTGKFQNVYTALFKKLNIQNRQERLNLLEFMSVIRNTIHNDWKYVPPIQPTRKTLLRMGSFTLSKTTPSIQGEASPREFTYKNQQYTFTPGEAVNFITWDMVMNFAKDLLEIFNEMIAHPSIEKIPEVIVEWFSLEE